MGNIYPTTSKNYDIPMSIIKKVYLFCQVSREKFEKHYVTPRGKGRSSYKVYI